jgi:leucine dehydrogenase
MSDLDKEFDHEQLELFCDPETGVKGAIAIHSTALGPAMGGLRLRAYPTTTSAATDALRLARAMSLKNSAAGLDLGGGKAVLIDDGNWGRRDARMRAFGAVIERLGGRFMTAEDVGTRPEDMDAIAGVTRWVAGRSVDQGGRGDPSPATARTVFGAIVNAAAVRLGARHLHGVRVGVQGVGHVGSSLVALLRAAGADVIVTDIDTKRAAAVAEVHDVGTAPHQGFLKSDVDVLAPCALGEAIDSADIGSLRCSVIAGAANNPLADNRSAVDLAEAGILYVPDFLANCGGIIHVAAEVLGFDQAEANRRIEAAIARTAQVLTEAGDGGRLPLDIAVERARSRILSARLP